MHRKLLFRREALQAVCTLRLDFQVRKFVPLEIEFVGESLAALFARQTYVFLHVQREVTLEIELLLAVLAVVARVDAVRSEVGSAVDADFNWEGKKKDLKKLRKSFGKVLSWKYF